MQSSSLGLIIPWIINSKNSRLAPNLDTGYEIPRILEPTSLIPIIMPRISMHQTHRSDCSLGGNFRGVIV